MSRPPQVFGRVAWCLVLIAGVAALVGATHSLGPGWLSQAGAVAVSTAMAWALATRVGGRAWIFGGLTLILGVAVALSESDLLRTGAAVLVCVVAAVLAVMATRPARTALAAFIEACFATLVGALGALAALGFEPIVNAERFGYITLSAALLCAFVVVFQLGAGFHGLGRRGLIVVLLGGAGLVATLAYAELVRRYGAPGFVDPLLDGRRWALETLGGAPRPVQALVGVPALVWGTQMRTRRRQGWWVCAFGVAAAAPVTTTVMDPRHTWEQAGLTTLYAVVLGTVIGLILTRIDRLLTEPRGRRAQLSEAPAVRQEAPRTQPLL